MTTLVFTHPSFGRHETPPGHVEQQGRYHAVEQAVLAPDVEGTLHREAPAAPWSLLNAAHSVPHVQKIRSLSNNIATELIGLAPDTFLGPHSIDAALRGVGGACAAVDAVMAGVSKNAFIAARPPGHHAVADHAMGFCVFNNAALAALHARTAHGCQRIAVVDFDVHHGNGTQDILEADEDAFFASTHEWPQYPGTGRADETGQSGNCHNILLAPGDGSRAFRKAWGDTLLPALDAFGPDFVVISAGFDAHVADPLGGLELTEEDFAWVTEQILLVAKDSCCGRVISVLEGGYNLAALASSAAAHVKTLATGHAAR